ncbi:MAG TPA: UbiD family decarboxylase [Xanthobacteraceae bacterium]|nr:UbiD family decarboxylase [Xanthobacteraceae bacterium]
MDAKTPAKKLLRNDLDQFRLRTFLESLIGTDQLEIREAPTDLADVAQALHGNTKAVWFKKVNGADLSVVGNVVGSRARLAHALGVTPDKLLPEIQRRLKLEPELVELGQSEAPVQEVVLTGADADLTKLPAHLQHALDGAPYISASIDYCVDPRTGQTNSGMRRIMLRGPHEAGIDLNAPSDLRAIYQAAVARGEKLPVSFVVGAHPIDTLSATMRIPVDELGLVASLRGGTMPVVKCRTNDIRVPADAELVIEGYLDERGYCEKEGPYGEYLGYYGVVKNNPVFHVTAITHRRDAVFQTATISGGRMDCTDTSNLEALRTELNAWRALESVVREPIAVYAPVAAGGSMSVRFSMKPRFPGEARSALYTVLGSVGAKNVFAVDGDVNIFDDKQMEWAFGTRFQPDRDLVVVTGVRSGPLDPSLHGSPAGSRAGYDLTWPLQHASRWDLVTPTPPTYQGKKFASVRAAVEDGPKWFEELMAATGSRDGREIVRELHKLRPEGLDRDDQGKYFLKKK